MGVGVGCLKHTTDIVCFGECSDTPRLRLRYCVVGKGYDKNSRSRSPLAGRWRQKLREFLEEIKKSFL